MDQDINQAIGREIVLRVLIMKDADTWLAQCVDYDLVAQASSLDDLEYEFERIVMVHVAACRKLKWKPFDSLDPAPESIRQAFQSESREMGFDPPRLKSGSLGSFPSFSPSARIYAGKTPTSLIRGGSQPFCPA